MGTSTVVSTPSSTALGWALRVVGWVIAAAGWTWQQSLSKDPDLNWHGSLTGEGDAPCRLAETCTEDQLQAMIAANEHRLWLASGVLLVGVVVAALGTRFTARGRRRPSRPAPSTRVLVALGIVGTGAVLVAALAAIVAMLGDGAPQWPPQTVALLALYALGVGLLRRWASPWRARAGVLGGGAVCVLACWALGLTVFRRAEDGMLVAAISTYLLVIATSIALTIRWAAQDGPPVTPAASTVPGTGSGGAAGSEPGVGA